MSPREAARAVLSSQDELFVAFLRAIFLLLALYGAGMTAVLLWGDSSVGSKMVSGFVSMFAGVIGLGSGYLVGARASTEASAPGPAGDG